MSNDYEVTARFVVRYPDDDWPSSDLVLSDVQSQLPNLTIESQGRIYDVVTAEVTNVQVD